MIHTICFFLILSGNCVYGIYDNNSIPANVTELQSSAMQVCCDNWINASHVDLGFIWFEKSETLNYTDAVRFCQRRQSHLIEILTEEQMNFVVNKLKTIKNHVKVVIWGDNLQGKGWWSGATDKDEEDTWVWVQSGKSVEEFVWGSGQPDDYGNEDYFWFLNWYGFKGGDVAGHYKMYPLCQQKR